MLRVKTLLAVLLTTLTCISARAATITWAVTNSDGTASSDLIKVYPITTPINVNGSWYIRGKPSSLQLVNGEGSLYLLQGNYVWTNTRPIIFAVPSGSGTYTVASREISGGNVYVYNPVAESGVVDTNTVNAIIEAWTFPLSSVTNSGNLSLWASEDPTELDAIAEDIATASARIDALEVATVTNAQIAQYAGFATNAASATNAQHATTADSATTATSAELATEATTAAYATLSGTATNTSGTHSGTYQLTGSTNVFQVRNPTTGTIPFWVDPNDKLRGDGSLLTGVAASGGNAYAVSNRVSTTGQSVALATIQMGTNQVKGARLLVIGRSSTGESLIQVLNVGISRGTGDPIVTNVSTGGGTDYTDAIADLQSQIDALELGGLDFTPQLGSANLTNLSALTTNLFVYGDQLTAATNQAVTSATNVAKAYTDAQINSLDQAYSAEFGNYTLITRHSADTNTVQTAAAAYADAAKTAATNKLATDILATAAATYATEARVVGATNKAATDILATAVATYQTKLTDPVTNNRATPLVLNSDLTVNGNFTVNSTNATSTVSNLVVSGTLTGAGVNTVSNSIYTASASYSDAAKLAATNKLATDILATAAATYATDARVLGATNKVATDILATAAATYATKAEQQSGTNLIYSAGTAYTDAATNTQAAAIAAAYTGKPTKTGTHASPDSTNPLSPTWTGEFHTVYCGGTMTINLPPATSGYDGRAIMVYNTGAFTITIDSNGSEVIVRDGTAQTGGVSITLSSGAGNYVVLLCDGARWVTWGYKGTLAQGS